VVSQPQFLGSSREVPFVALQGNRNYLTLGLGLEFKKSAPP
jgi:hypothetical protein